MTVTPSRHKTTEPMSSKTKSSYDYYPTKLFEPIFRSKKLPGFHCGGADYVEYFAVFTKKLGFKIITESFYFIHSKNIFSCQWCVLHFFRMYSHLIVRLIVTSNKFSASK